MSSPPDDKVHCCPEALCRALAGRRWPDRGWRLSGGRPTAAAVLVGLFEARGQPHVVLTQRAGSLRDHPGQVSFPGGRVEADDPSPEATALREAWEEVGLELSQAQILGRLGRYHTGTGFVIEPVVAWLRGPFCWRPCPVEVAEVFELPLDRIMEARIDEEVRVYNEIGELLRFPAMTYQGKTIWGATAGILWQLREALRENAN